MSVVTRVEVYQDAAGEWRWRARAGNNRIVADSGEGYHNRGDALEMATAPFAEAAWSHADDSDGGETDQVCTGDSPASDDDEP